MSALPWLSQLIQGTSVERRMLSSSGGASSRARQQQRRVEALRSPGAWLRHPSPRGLVKLWSPSGGGPGSDDRSHHQHFALLTSLRTGMRSTAATSLSSADPTVDAVDDYVTCLLQGMGIQYRPEQAVASVVSRQSLNDLVSDSAVGTYWNALLKSSRAAAPGSPASTTDDPPILSVLSNSTRSHGFLSNLAAQMKDVAVAPRHGAAGGSGSTSLTSVRHGWYLRDVALGLLPEEDDCLEALSHCLDVRDRYRPPNRFQDDDDDQDGEDF